MTRQEFLKTQWRPYPSPAELASEPGWIFGKVTALQAGEGSPGQLTLDSQVNSINLAGVDSAVHPILGPAIPAALVVLGDCLAFLQNETKKTLLGPFLLSPCLFEGAPLLNTGKQWQQFLELVRDYFRLQGFQHWTTPYLVPSSGVDAHIDFMKVKGVRTNREFFLPTSPEFELKKALANGQQKIFEIKSSFRDDDASPIHNSEFTMLEWYRAYAGKWELLKDFEGLLTHVQPLFGNSLTEVDISVQRRPMAGLFSEYVGLELKPDTSRDELLWTIRHKNLHWTDEDDWDDLFFRLYIEYVEPALGRKDPVAVYNFPATQSSLAQRTPDGWADRFEIYWKGVELANAYQEQNNPFIVREKIESEIQKRKNLGRQPHQKDEAFVNSILGGFPPSAGIALGLDRLFMLLAGKNSINKANI